MSLGFFLRPDFEFPAVDPNTGMEIPGLPNNSYKPSFDKFTHDIDGDLEALDDAAENFNRDAQKAPDMSTDGDSTQHIIVSSVTEEVGHMMAMENVKDTAGQNGSGVEANIATNAVSEVNLDVQPEIAVQVQFDKNALNSHQDIGNHPEHYNFIKADEILRKANEDLEDTLEYKFDKHMDDLLEEKEEECGQTPNRESSGAESQPFLSKGYPSRVNVASQNKKRTRDEEHEEGIAGTKTQTPENLHALPNRVLNLKRPAREDSYSAKRTWAPFNLETFWTIANTFYPHRTGPHLRLHLVPETSIRQLHDLDNAWVASQPAGSATPSRRPPLRNYNQGVERYEDDIDFTANDILDPLHLSDSEPQTIFMIKHFVGFPTSICNNILTVVDLIYNYQRHRQQQKICR